MVIALGPGKFYGSSLPRPRFYTDVKFNAERVDPPSSVMDPLMAWAEEAHWSMGGLNSKRHRLQGRIEGNIQRLRIQREQTFKKSEKQHEPVSSPAIRSKKDKKNSRVSETETPSPQPPPVAIKRRRVVGLVDEEEEVVAMKKGPVRKLGDDFERVARESGIENSSDGESGDSVAARTRGKKNEANVAVDEGQLSKRRKLVNKGGRKIGASVVAAAIGIRRSPRQAKNSGST